MIVDSLVQIQNTVKLKISSIALLRMAALYFMKVTSCFGKQLGITMAKPFKTKLALKTGASQHSIKVI